MSLLLVCFPFFSSPLLSSPLLTALPQMLLLRKIFVSILFEILKGYLFFHLIPPTTLFSLFSPLISPLSFSPSFFCSFRLDESKPEEAKGVYDTLNVIENMTELSSTFLTHVCFPSPLFSLFLCLLSLLSLLFSFFFFFNSHVPSPPHLNSSVNKQKLSNTS